MSKLHSVGRTSKGLFGSLRLFALAGFAAAAGLVTAPAFAQDCEFTAPTAVGTAGDAGWQPGVDESSGALLFVAPTGGSATLPTVSDANAAACAGEGAVSYKLYSADGTELMGVDTSDPADSVVDIFNLLVLADGNATADPVVPGSTISIAASAGALGAGATVSYTASTETPDFHRAMPVSFMLRAEKAYSGGEGAEFSFTVTIRPVAHAAPTAVFATSESSNSIYVEWTGDDNPSNTTTDPVTPDTTATSYVVTASWTPEGAMMASMRSVTVMDTATGTTGTAGSPVTGTNPRQSATITGLPAGETFTITVMGISAGGAPTGNQGPTASPAATVDTGDLTYTSMEPYTLSVDETVDLDISSFISPEIDEDATDEVTADLRTEMTDQTDDQDQRPVGTTFMITATAGNTAVRVEHITDDDMDHTDDILRLHGLAEGTYTVVLTATAMHSMMAGDVITASIPVKVVENHEPMFRISEATVDWDIDNVGGASKST